MSKEKQFAVLGLGRFGQSIVKTLIDSGCMVLACDSDEDVVREVSKIATHCVQVNLIDESSVLALGLNNFDVVVIAIAVDMQASIMATLLAKKHGAKYVLAKALNDTHKAILEKVGADKVVLPEREMGRTVAKNLISERIVDDMYVTDEYSIMEIEPLPEWIGKSSRDLLLEREHDINIIAIKRGEGVIVDEVSVEKLIKGDIVFIIGDNYEVRELVEQSDLKIRKFMKR